MKHKKREIGQYYTNTNPFTLKPFITWADKISLKDKIVLEPFAGDNNLINFLNDINILKDYKSFDISPSNNSIKKKDTIKNFPKGFEVTITNPPWLARNSAKRRGINFPKTKYSDIYLHCLDLMLKNCKYVGVLIPASFLQTKFPKERLDTFILLHDKNIFNDTDNPVALALFGENETQDTKIFYDNKSIGNLKSLKELIPSLNKEVKINFNDPNGELGFIAFDNTKEASIKFFNGKNDKTLIKNSSRMITRIGLEGNHNIKELVKLLNQDIDIFRKKTKDVFLTPFKGLRDDRLYRRRMNYSLARRFIAHRISSLNKFKNFPKKKYDIIYIDPPWRYGGEMNNSIDAKRHYPTLSFDELKTMPVPDICKDNSLLFMWVVSPEIKKCIEVGEAWNFNYITVGFVWEKGNKVFGNYTMSSVELCLIFKRGKIPQPRGRRNIYQFLQEKTKRHSAKPLEIRRRIQKMFPTQKKIELFARVNKNSLIEFKTWDFWGNEAEPN